MSPAADRRTADSRPRIDGLCPGIGRPPGTAEPQLGPARAAPRSFLRPDLPPGTERASPLTDEPIQTFASVWDAIADTPAEAANLRLRSELMDQIAAAVAARGWTQSEAATHCGVTQPRMNDLLRGRISRFSLDALVNIAAALGLRVQVRLEAA